MNKTLREWIDTINPLSLVNFGMTRMKAYEVLSQHVYLEKLSNGEVNMFWYNIDTYNYRVKYNKANGIWSIKIYG